jgi:hypothetical protein
MKATDFGKHPNDGKTELLPLHHDESSCIFRRLTNFDSHPKEHASLPCRCYWCHQLHPAFVPLLVFPQCTLAAAFDSMQRASSPWPTLPGLTTVTVMTCETIRTALLPSGPSTPTCRMPPRSTRRRPAHGYAIAAVRSSLICRHR